MFQVSDTPDGEIIDVISIQSQVVYGSVGNSIAVPALRRHGLRVVAVPTVLLSNTPHYASCYGGEIPQPWFEGYLTALAERNLDVAARAAVLGYLKSTDKAAALARWLRLMREKNPLMSVIIDPVLGDDDSGFYVDPELATHYREQLAPLATGLTPNRFELGCLCNARLESDAEIVDAARSLLSAQTQWVVVTSATRDDARHSMQVFCVTADNTFITEHPRYDNPPKGTGDLFTAELTAGLLRAMPLNAAVEQASLFAQQSVLATRTQGRRELQLASAETV
ncbi:pyridoxine/pyridoxal/pyridoxamine kinase [Candidatus Pantoea deserta]|uniref:pyridoxal kinase n=1 Tax=Candidatus Pantoea deserta TaxID=1869313 RepID=A0A3N4P6S8_9GAMM|nr:pyridoxine/pyridoxal/pyridoxamine kinase [Pantoea deserta]RPE03048.1 pyridoxine/pyridoxal/pyridoxamine kinase [Pantoea deserta]